MKYQRVLPRDLFNEAKLLKCMGQLILSIEGGKLENKLQYHFDGEDFNISQDQSDGSIRVGNISVWKKGLQLYFYTPLNSRLNYPLRVTDIGEEIYVFEESGLFTEEFKNFIK